MFESPVVEEPGSRTNEPKQRFDGDSQEPTANDDGSSSAPSLVVTNSKSPEDPPMKYFKKGSCIQQWKPPFLVIPLNLAATLASVEDHSSLQLPCYRPCTVLSQCSQEGQMLLKSSSYWPDDDERSKSWKYFRRKLRRDGSSQAYCMLATLELVLAPQENVRSWRAMVEESTAIDGETSSPLNKARQTPRNEPHLPGNTKATIKTGSKPTELESVSDNWCLQEGWTYVQDKISFPDCCELYHQIKGSLHLLTLPHPLLVYATKTLFGLTEEEFECAMNIFYSKHWIRQRTEQQQHQLPTETTNMTMNRLRASHLLQEYISTLPSRVVGVLLKEPLGTGMSIPSSCLPNAILEVQATTMGMNRHKNMSQQLMGQPQFINKCSLIALYDLEPGEEPTVGTSSRPFSNRETCQCPRCRYERRCNDGAELLEAWTKLPRGLRQINRLAHAYFQEGQYEQAELLYRLCHDTYAANIRTESQTSMGEDDNVQMITSRDEEYDDNAVYDPQTDDDYFQRQAADSWHSIGAVELTQYNFINAQRHWRASNPLYRKYSEGLSLQLEKQSAYQYLEPLVAATHKKDDGATTNASRTTIDTPTTTLAGYQVDCDCYNVTNGPPSGVLVTRHPIVSPSTCQQLIQWAHDHVSSTSSSSSDGSGGWTTNRHYAVPTTDIPIHESPKLLAWFQEFMATVAHPLLQRQFGMNSSKRFYVHDAFLVRYSASNAGEGKVASTSSPSSNFLPLHYDESTHSFVLALNQEFEGGGTYFYRLDKTIIPPATGTMVTFRGNQWLHGGSVVTSGVRYIIAAFLHLDHDSSCVVEKPDLPAKTSTPCKQPFPAPEEDRGKPFNHNEESSSSSSSSNKRQKKLSLSQDQSGFSFGFF